MASPSEGSSRKRASSNGEKDESKRSRKLEEEGTKIILKCDGLRLSDCDPVAVARMINKQAKNVKRVVPLRDGGLMVITDEEGAEKLNQLKNYQGRLIEKTLVEKRTQTVKGIIHGVTKLIEEDYILKNLRVSGSTKVVEVRRLGKDERATESVVIMFEGEDLPDKVFLGYRAFNVKVFIPKPTRCYKCQRFGHIASKCNFKGRCPTCGEDHEFMQCNKKETPVCCNCGGDHSAGFTGCKVFGVARQINSVKVTERLTYAEAAKKVTEVQGEDTRKDQPGSSSTGSSREVDTGKVLVDMSMLASSLTQLFVMISNPGSKPKTVSDMIKCITKIFNDTLSVNINPGEIFKKLPKEVKDPSKNSNGK